MHTPHNQHVNVSMQDWNVNRDPLTSFKSRTSSSKAEAGPSPNGPPSMCARVCIHTLAMHTYVCTQVACTTQTFTYISKLNSWLEWLKFEDCSVLKAESRSSELALTCNTAQNKQTNKHHIHLLELPGVFPPSLPPLGFASSAVLLLIPVCSESEEGQNHTHS